MKLNKHLYVAACLCLPLGGTSLAATPPAAGETHFLERTFTPLSAAMVRQPFKIKVRNSPKLSALIRQSLRAQGYTVREDDEEAAVSFELFGAYGIEITGKEKLSGQLEEITDVALDPNRPADSLAYDSVLGRQMAIGAVLTQTISLTSLVSYLGQRSGISGWINQALTGDPRGWCLSANCYRDKTTVLVHVLGKSPEGKASWNAIGTRHAATMVIDRVLADTLERVLQPFATLAPPADTGVPARE